MTSKLVHFDRIGPVTFNKNRRSKNIKINVKPDRSVRVSFPFYVSASEVAGFVMKNIEWITIQQQKFETRKSEKFDMQDLHTKLHHIVFVNGPKNKTTINFKEIEVAVIDFNSEESKKYIENVITVIYRYEAEKILPGRLAELAQMHGFQFNKISIRNNKRNWGSCSARNNISLNLQMMKLPDELIDYILLHELVHTKIKNHGPGFWEKLNEITGNKARELAKQVRKYSTYTL